MNKFPPAEDISMIIFQEKVNAEQTLRTRKAKIWRWSDYSCSKKPFPKNQWLHFIHQQISQHFIIIKNIRERQLFCLAPPKKNIDKRKIPKTDYPYDLSG